MKRFIHLIISFLLSNHTMAQEHQWSFGIGGTSTETIEAIEYGGDETIIVTGNFGSQDLDFDPQAGQSLASPLGGYDMFLAKYAEDSLVWFKTFAGTAFNAARDVAVASNGDILITGTFSDVVNFDPDGNYELDAGTGADAFVARYGSDGSFQSAFALVGDHQTTGAAIELDDSGNIYLAGTLSDSADFDPGSGIVQVNNDPGGLYLAKYSASGGYQWAFGISGVGGTDAKDLDVTPDGTAFVTGLFQQTVDLDPGAGTDSYTADGVDSYVIKINSSGGYEWGRVFTGNGSEVTFGLSHAEDFSGPITEVVYVCGRFDSEIDLDPTAGTEIIPNPTGSNAFVTKLDGDGNYIWGRYIGNQGDGRFIDVEASGFDVSLAGYFNGTIIFPDSSTAFSSGGSDILYVEMSNQGVFENQLIFGGTSNDVITTGSTLLSSFRQTFGGAYSNNIDFGPGQDTLSGPIAQGNEDMFLVQYGQQLSPSVSELSRSSVTVYPNPTEEFIRVQKNERWDTYSILDVCGREVSFGSWSNANRIDVSDLLSGAYFLRLLNPDGRVSGGKFTKL